MPVPPERFGVALRRLRERAGLSQEQLAERAGLSPRAIRALELGERQRPHAHTVRVLANGLGLDAAEVSCLVAAIPARAAGLKGGEAAAAHANPAASWYGDTSTVSRVPPPEPRAGLPPDPIAHFAGRQNDLTWLHYHLPRRRRLAIHGLGGIGKTQLANQYLHRFRADYPDGCYWLRGDDPIAMHADLASLAWHLQLSEREIADQQLVVESVFRWLRAHNKWLLVIDNVDEPLAVEAIRSWLPPGLPGSVLITSRTAVWSGSLELVPLSEVVAARFLILQRGLQEPGLNL